MVGGGGLRVISDSGRKWVGLGVVGVSNSSVRSFGGKESLQTRLDMAAMLVDGGPDGGCVRAEGLRPYATVFTRIRK